MKSGHWVRRHNWVNVRHVYLEEYFEYVVPGGIYMGTKRKYEKCICAMTSNDVYQPGWLPSMADLLATDWEIVTP